MRLHHHDIIFAVCPNPEPIKGKQRCNNTQFVPADEETPTKTDYQEIKVRCAGDN